MPHAISTGKHQDIIILRYYGNIESDDIITNPQELHLNEGSTKYLLVDASEVHPSVPEGMWDRVRESVIYNQNLLHIAIYVKSLPLRILMGAVFNLTRQQKRVSLHESFADAEGHVLGLIKSARG